MLKSKRSSSVVINIIVAFLSIFMLSCGQNNNTDNTSKDKSSKIDEIVSLYADYGMFNGSVLVVDKGEVIYKNGLGLANMEWDISNTVDTKYRLASVTKPFTAIMIMQMVADNTLDLQEPISTYLPDYPKENGDQITIHHLLTHTSGTVRDYDSDKKINQFPDRAQLKQLVSEFSGLPLEFKPGKKFSYSNSGFMVLAHIIETVSGKNYETMLQENILDVVGMKNTGTDKHRPIIKNRAKGYFKSFGSYYNCNYVDMSTIPGVGNIYSTVGDLFLLDQALYDDTLLPKKHLDVMLTKHVEDPSYGGFHGYGWEFINKPIGNTSETIETIGHSGSIDGFRALFTRIPSSNSSIMLLNNTSHAFLTSMTTAITGILYDKPYDLPLIPLAQFMIETIENEGIDKGIQFYKEHKDSPDYYISEQELNVAGYKFLHAENAKDAAEVFKLSTEVFPDRDNPYDSYAEALRALGKNEEAIENYKKSIDLNPKNNNAKEMLKELEVDYLIDLLKVDDTWVKEIITFPIGWAPKMTVNGFEELRFAPEWSNAKHEDFWSLVMAWKLITPTEITMDELQINLESYYDGLMTPNHWSKEFPKPSLELFDTIKTETSTEFKGRMTIFDGFHTGEIITLNILGRQQLCKSTGKSIIVFKFSPKAYTEPIWKHLNNINLKDDSCR
ncbi:serine hydrolase [Psychroserpens jangbogonensis]|uniref:serine hydrolase n=1 Tax=Psychroserpens jangbogonensis TaxID=1484460 RepID=UPI00068FDCAA|nr:serine hydrolase [Psychroserpens jangbogonensis]